MVYKEGPLCSRGSAFGLKSTDLLLTCLINLLPKSFGTLFSLSEPFCNISGGLPRIWRAVFSPPCLWATSGATPARCHWTMLIQGEGAPLPASHGSKFWLHKRTWKGLGTNLGAPLIRLIRTWVQIQACFRRQKGNLINSQRHLSHPFLGWNHIFQVQWVGWKFCAMWECVKVWACEVAWLQNKGGASILGSVVNSYGLGEP
jgi:hypothetical protein